MDFTLLVQIECFIYTMLMRYNPKKIEQKWRKKWFAADTYEPDMRRAKHPFYNLMMFPYPSAEGLHIGNMYAFTGSDIYGRLKRMQSYDVFEPIGLDGFGIHSENYAIKIGAHPMRQAKISQKKFYQQLNVIGDSFAWNERLETYDPEYYKWTQWIFVQMFKAGLAYRKKQAVNWCPSCKTVLADEQVVAGQCERCSSAVIKKELEQWFFRITKYAGRLLKNLEKIDWSERVKIAQRNWIGKSEGVVIKFSIFNFQFSNKSKIQNSKQYIEVFTTRPDTIFGATFMVISPEQGKLWQNSGWRASEDVRLYITEALGRRSLPEDKKPNKKTGVFSGVSVINPANKEKIPVWISDYVLGDVGTGAIMAVPAHDERDFEFAKKYNLPIKIVVCQNYPEKTCPILEEAYLGEGHLVGSGKFDGMPSPDAQKKITEYVHGKVTTHYRLRDWLISRQRYWGPPIPMIFCEPCCAKDRGERKNMPGWYAVAEKNLPVKLPFVKNFRPTGTDQSPLGSVASFYKIRCPACRKWARRETDVSDTFLDSAWYFLRYPSVKNKKVSWDTAITKKWLPVSMYIGGAEHSVLHLLYSRFLTMALCDIGVLKFSAKGEEPFSKFRAHGLIIKDGAKMSKSRGNVINPDDYIKAYGADAVRMYLAFLAPFEQDGDFRDTGIRGMTRFLERVWAMASNQQSAISNQQENNKTQNGLTRVIHRAIKKVGEDIEGLHYNTAISALMVLLNEFEQHQDALTQEHRRIFLKLLAPFAPHITEELWQKFGSQKPGAGSQKFRSIHHESWPKFNPRLMTEQMFELVVQVNGTFRGKIKAAMGISEDNARQLGKELATVKPHLSGTPRKIIFVPDKLINFVI